MSTQVLVKKTNGNQEFMNFKEFSRVDVLDEHYECANVYVRDKLVGKIMTQILTAFGITEERLSGENARAIIALVAVRLAITKYQVIEIV